MEKCSVLNIDHDAHLGFVWPDPTVVQALHCPVLELEVEVLENWPLVLGLAKLPEVDTVKAGPYNTKIVFSDSISSCLAYLPG